MVCEALLEGQEATFKEPGKSVSSSHVVPLTMFPDPCAPFTHAVVEVREGHLSQFDLPV